MEQEQLNEIKKMIKSSAYIINYLNDYLKDDIDQIIEDYELDIEQMADDEVPQVIGYRFGYNNIIHVIINFFDECSESGIGLNYKKVDLTDFITWISENC